MSEMNVEGYRVKIEKQPEGDFVASVPELPGCSIQVARIEEVEAQMKDAIRAYLLELSSHKPNAGKRAGTEPAPREMAKLKR
jgi:predicted RNase H-like HicB family nuclease